MRALRLYVIKRTTRKINCGTFGSCDKRWGHVIGRLGAKVRYYSHVMRLAPNTLGGEVTGNYPAFWGNGSRVLVIVVT